MTDFKQLKGKVIKKIYKIREEELIFLTEKEIFRMWHAQDCCECVELTDICGDLEDLINSEILQAEEVSQQFIKNDESITWTFYKLRTTKGSVTLRWKGESNGYYSEEVDFDLITGEKFFDLINNTYVKFNILEVK